MRDGATRTTGDEYEVDVYIGHHRVAVVYAFDGVPDSEILKAALAIAEMEERKRQGG